MSSTEVLCRQPDLRETDLGPFPMPSYLEVSLDGQKYSQSLKRYDIVGPAVGIEAAEEVRFAAKGPGLFAEGCAWGRCFNNAMFWWFHEGTPLEEPSRGQLSTANHR